MQNKNVPAALKDRKVVVIVGGGFGGLNAARALSRRKDVFVILIDQKNHHLFQPMLYQVATAGLNPADIAAPIRAQFTPKDCVEVRWAEVKKVDLAKSELLTGDRETPLHYDYLILACGSQHSYFGHPEWEDFAPGLKSLEQATEIRRRILSAFEKAETETDPAVQEALMNFVVVGGGPTGVELAGAIADLSRTVLVHDFKRINPSKAKVILVESGPRLLAPFLPQISERTKKDLNELGVEVRTGKAVSNIDATGVSIGDEFIPARTVCWAAGVQASPLVVSPDVKSDRAGRIQVSNDLSIPGFPNAFVVGDMASLEMSPGRIVPGLAPAAIQEGKHAARMILNTLNGKARSPFHYLDKGQMATIGKNRAVMQMGKLHMGGLIAWIAWLFIHIFYLIGFNNRIRVITQWAWSYIFSKRGSRLITSTQWKLKKKASVEPADRGTRPPELTKQ